MVYFISGNETKCGLTIKPMQSCMYNTQFRLLSPASALIPEDCSTEMNKGNAGAALQVIYCALAMGTHGAFSGLKNEVLAFSCQDIVNCSIVPSIYFSVKRIDRGCSHVQETMYRGRPSIYLKKIRYKKVNTTPIQAKPYAEKDVQMVPVQRGFICLL